MYCDAFFSAKMLKLKLVLELLKDDRIIIYKKKGEVGDRRSEG